MEVNYLELGNRIREKREDADLTQEKLAELSGRTAKHISAIENATTKVGLPTLLKIANILDTTVDYLLIDSLDKKEVIYEAEIIHMIAGHKKKVMERLMI
ncbi:MAG: helix-turn-helix transcriptional regulator, partial [Lachnospiraceae bacterium]